ncbi:X-box-binding protein 1-like isoform X3 [Dendroctonus ponderosae]|uniref:X-box-binding protein 1 n=1 Tax=Dendroctonus ponderosae TaxID=77166 RepID=A0AAR5PNQ7_DENPD|nr:X-box-binding protein 1 isoform X3 [Dendroctonus ponderosae]XP_048518810.1 X-box-binding protein 1-like isoform X3 [Dendroctonus ponderosae]
MTSTVLPVPAILSILSDSNYLLDQTADGQMQRAKKRRLDHLSWEEKIQRKKLKNRVAAQTSRDRKKAKVEQMETAIQQLFNKNETLIGECDRLRATNERLLAENSELHRRLQETPPCQCQSRTVVCAPESGSTESLLRPKGTSAYSAAALADARKRHLLRTVLICLLFQSCLTSWSRTRSTSTRSSTSLRPYSRTLPEIWRTLLRRQPIKTRKLFQTKWWGRQQSSWNPVAAQP